MPCCCDGLGIELFQVPVKMAQRGPARVGTYIIPCLLKGVCKAQAWLLLIDGVGARIRTALWCASFVKS